MAGSAQSPPQPLRILAIDPALRNTGYAVLTVDPGARRPVFRALAYGVISNKPSVRPSGCLVAIHAALDDIITEYKPEECAVEGVIFVQSYRTAITLGAARGAAILAAARNGLSIFEYAPRRVKQAIVGKGSADKQQVAFMIRALLSLTETPPPDAADALAIGLAHLHARERPGGLAKDIVPI